MKKTIIYSAFALLLGSGALLSSCAKSDGAENAPKTVETFTVKTGTVTNAQMTATFKAKD